MDLNCAAIKGPLKKVMVSLQFTLLVHFNKYTLGKLESFNLIVFI